MVFEELRQAKKGKKELKKVARVGKKGKRGAVTLEKEKKEEKFAVLPLCYFLPPFAHRVFLAKEHLFPKRLRRWVKVVHVPEKNAGGVLKRRG